jgi:hypothetical protein
LAICQGRGLATPKAQAFDQTTTTTYIAPIWTSFIGASDADVAAAVQTLRDQVGEGGAVRLGFTTYIQAFLGDWHVDVNNPTALRAALGTFEAQLDTALTRARANNIVLVVTFLTATRESTDPAQVTSYDEDRRVMQWYGDNNSVATGWWTESRYARRQYLVQQAYMKEIAKILASRMALYPDTFVGIAGDGEVELSNHRDQEQPPALADYSPFAIAEFRDWLKGDGLYDVGGPFEGEAYSLAARYHGDAGPGTDSNHDGHTLNGDFGTSFDSWSLRYFDWSLTDDPTIDPHAIPAAVYGLPGFNPSPDAGAGNFDAPRVAQPANGWWQVFDLFRQTMIWHHNKDLARWMTTTPDANGNTVPHDKWFTYQLPADYLFGFTPSNPNPRLLSSASPWWTANAEPYAGLGFTAFGQNVAGAGTVYRTLPNLLDAIRPCAAGQSGPTCLAESGGLASVPWGIFEWNPAVPVRDPNTGASPPSPDPSVYRDEIERLRRYRPRILAPFLWGNTGDYQILGTGFGTALRAFSTYLQNGWAPSLRVNRTTLNFAVRISGGVARKQTSAQSVLVSQPTGGTVAWSASVNQSWLSLSSTSGFGDGSFNVSLDSNGVAQLHAGSYSGTVTVSAPGSIEGQQTIACTLEVINSDHSQDPIGVFDTPADGTTGLTGSFAVTGWALDDIEIDRVEIWRDRVNNNDAPGYYGPGHPGNGKIFIAKAAFIEGSRTDVETKYSHMPLQYRAGWGYLLLSWGLFEQGNHTYNLYAFAFDNEDNHTTLGIKTITVDNAHASKPFGALDTPGYGATVAGSFWNFGWALTPNDVNGNPTCRINNGRVFMTIDGAPPYFVANYGDPRNDIAAGFPGFSNGNGAGGAYFLDTTTYTNGTHYIGWYVVDSCNRADGMGSRPFNIQNTSGDAPLAPIPAALLDSKHLADAYTAFPHVDRPVTDVPAPDRAEALRIARTGTRALVPLPADPSGLHTALIGQQDRVELYLPASSAPARTTSRPARYEAYQVVGGTLRRLPIGSSFDPDRGIFYWQPVPGYLGSFDFVFLRTASQVPDRRFSVRLVVGRSTATTHAGTR